MPKQLALRKVLGKARLFATNGRRGNGAGVVDGLCEQAPVPLARDQHIQGVAHTTCARPGHCAQRGQAGSRELSTEVVARGMIPLSDADARRPVYPLSGWVLASLQRQRRPWCGHAQMGVRLAVSRVRLSTGLPMLGRLAPAWVAAKYRKSPRSAGCPGVGLAKPRMPCGRVDSDDLLGLDSPPARVLRRAQLTSVELLVPPGLQPPTIASPSASSEPRRMLARRIANKPPTRVFSQLHHRAGATTTRCRQRTRLLNAGARRIRGVIGAYCRSAHSAGLTASGSRQRRPYITMPAGLFSGADGARDVKAAGLDGGRRRASPGGSRLAWIRH